MPTPTAILESIALLAAEWRGLAVGWHAALAIAALTMLWHPQLRRRTVAIAIVLPLVSVSALAWWSGNPFNGTVFAVVTAALLHAIWKFEDRSVAAGPGIDVIAGVALTLFGLVYPHFVNAASSWEYLVAAPFGLIPCPTVAVLAGVSLTFDVFGSRAWARIVGSVAFTYGVIGVFVLGVTIDAALVAGGVFMFAASTPAKRHAAAPS